MSLPTAAAVAPAAMAAQGMGMPAIGVLDAVLMTLNSNPYFIGLMMVLLNLGGRFISLEMSRGQEQFFQNPWVRRLLIFTVLFAGTRNIMVAFWMTLVIVLLIGYLFNENSSLCLFHFGNEGSACAKDAPKTASLPPPGGNPMANVIAASSGLSPEEADILRRLSDKQQRYAAVAAAQQKEASMKEKAKYNTDSMNSYWQAMTSMPVIQRPEGFAGNPRF
jgi:hypothetical protein